jgi:hypothetical protein
MIENLLKEVSAEADRQSKIFGDSWDDSKSAMDWLMLYMEWIGKVGGAITMERFREKSKQLAALAVKAMASADRRIASDGAAPKLPDPSEVDDEDKSILRLALEACEDAIKTVECPSYHKDGEFRWHRLARMALDKAKAV